MGMAILIFCLIVFVFGFPLFVVLVIAALLVKVIRGIAEIGNNPENYIRRRH